DSIMLMPMDRVSMMRKFGARPAKGYATREELVARYHLEPAETEMASPEVIHRMAMHSGREATDKRWQHKADRRGDANFQPTAACMRTASRSRAFRYGRRSRRRRS